MNKLFDYCMLYEDFAEDDEGTVENNKANALYIGCVWSVLLQINEKRKQNVILGSFRKDLLLYPQINYCQGRLLLTYLILI